MGKDQRQVQQDGRQQHRQQPERIHAGKLSAQSPEGFPIRKFRHFRLLRLTDLPDDHDHPAQHRRRADQGIGQQAGDDEFLEPVFGFEEIGEGGKIIERLHLASAYGAADKACRTQGSEGARRLDESPHRESGASRQFGEHHVSPPRKPLPIRLSRPNSKS